ncbi:hypothetical protein ACAG26_16745 [Mycobacterium sp. pUA109]|uniref:hypothetical protein n=1 Tax=Mycobacterium sp. pUA109 TaxID=3238982 RepID=UPI00351AF3D7
MNAAAAEDAAAQVDALVAGIGPRVRPPAVQRRDVVLVTGPWLAGVTGVAAALRDRLPDLVFVESTELAPGEAPAAVVFVVSAAAALTASDCALLDAAVVHTDPVVCAVSKIDVHRGWSDMLAGARDMLAGHAPRYRHVPWVGVAAAPQQGEPRVDELVEMVRDQLADVALARRNRLRAWESRLQTAVDRHDHEVEGRGRRARVSALQEQRDTALRQRRLAKSERTIALRSQIQQARVQLTYFARNRCGSVRSELQEDAAGMTRRKLPEFEAYTRSRIDEVLAEVNQGCAEHLADVAQELELSADLAAAAELPEVPVPDPALKSRRLETRLMMLLGAGFGLGVALTLSRLFADLAPGWTAAGAAVCAVIGLGLTVWVVGIRGVLHDRAVLDRWVGEVTASLRSAVEQLVATRVLAAESALLAALSEHDAAEAEKVAEQVKVIDGELREHAVAAARAAATRDREMPALRRALETVRAELGQPDSDESEEPDSSEPEESEEPVSDELDESEERDSDERGDPDADESGELALDESAPSEATTAASDAKPAV